MSFYTTSLIPASTGLIALGAVLTTGGGASAQDFDGITPVEADRWMYPFNATPGVRPGGSVFGYCPFPQDEQVDNRDGQIVVAFDTTGIVPEGQGANRYQVDALVLEITLSGPASGPLDITSDAWQTYLPETAKQYQDDEDAGRPIEMFAAGFRFDYTRTTWTEDAPFSVSSPFGTNNRTVFAAGFEAGSDDLLDISSSYNDQVTPTPLGVATFSNVAAGDVPAEGDVAVFQVDLDQPGAREWVGESLDEGRIVFAVTSLISAAQGDSVLTQFYLRENPLVTVGVRDSATLLLSGTIGDVCDKPTDFNADCKVDGADLGAFLGMWGEGAGSPADVNGDGAVNGGDLGEILATFGSY